MPKIIKLLERVDGKETEHTDRYLVYANPDMHAQRFPDAGAALEYWRTPVTCPCHAIREDGKPNRPLTAYTVTIEDALS